MHLDGQPFRWEPEEQIFGLDGPLRAHLLSPGYRRAAGDSEASHRFTVDEALLAERWQPGSDGTT